jgi:hypothetical protein
MASYQTRAFQFGLGDIVALSPTGVVGNGSVKGKVIGRTEYIDGSEGYVVSVISAGQVMRHHVSGCELVRTAA